MRRPGTGISPEDRRTEDRRAEAHPRRREARPETAGRPEPHRGATLFPGYSDEYTPLGGYATLLGVYAGVFGGLLIVGEARGRLPDRIGAAEIALFGVATHEITRTLTRDWVTAPIRAPFVRYEKSLGAGEVAETSRGRGLRRALGDLLTCPWCTGPWVAAALVAGWTARPRTTTLIAGTFAVAALSDSLHHVYRALKKLAG